MELFVPCIFVDDMFFGSHGVPILMYNETWFSFTFTIIYFVVRSQRNIICSIVLVRKLNIFVTWFDYFVHITTFWILPAKIILVRHILRVRESKKILASI